MISEIKLRIGIFKKYKNLLGNLVSRDIKVRYRRSVHALDGVKPAFDDDSDHGGIFYPV